MFFSLIVLIIFFTALVIGMDLERKRKARSVAAASKLPGPKGLPIIGNVHELPAKCSWMKFAEWSEKYGPIYQVNLAGTNHVWITRNHIAHDLLSRRSAIYSDRPLIPALERDNRTSGQYLPLMSNNQTWARQRKFGKQIMDQTQQDSFYGYPELEAVRLLFELMTDSSRYNTHMETFIARVTSRLAWGTPVAAEELKQRARELLIGVSPAGALGNKVPAIMSLPERLSKAKAWELRRGRTEKAFFEVMQKEVAQSPDTSSPKRSWTSMFLKNEQSWGFSSPLEGAYAVGMHGIAGALTVAAPMQSFCLAMCHYPQYQATLHEELDRVLGDRMPTFADMKDMPVLRAFIRETLRWRPPVPTGIPHELIRDDVYEGYHIPKGSVVHPLEWSISRDPDEFPDPEEWNPLRWLKPDYPTYQEPLSKYPTITEYSQFGYGRRVCQGMAVTEADLFVGLGSVAWLFSMHGDETALKNAAAADASQSIVESPPYRSRTRSPRSSVCSVSKSTSCTASGDSDGNKAIQHTAMYTGLTSHPNDSAISLPHDSDSNHAIPTVVSAFSAKGSRVSLRSSFSSSEPPEKQPRSYERYDQRSSSEQGLETATFRYTEAPLHTVQSDDENVTCHLPGRYPSTPPHSILEKDRNSQEPAYEHDPTMDFSTLLIAKPMPFRFDLRIRNQARAEFVAREWIKQKVSGEYEESRVYWKGGNQGDAVHGWGEVFS